MENLLMTGIVGFLAILIIPYQGGFPLLLFHDPYEIINVQDIFL